MYSPIIPKLNRKTILCFSVLYDFTFCCYHCIFFFRRHHLQHMRVPRLGVQSELQLQAYATATQCWIWAASATHAAACSNARSLTHWMRPGIELTSSQWLCRVLNPLNHNRNSLSLHFLNFLIYVTIERAKLIIMS